TALAEYRVGLVEQQDGAHIGSLGEDPFQVLLGLTDVLVHNGGKVHCVQIQTEVGGDHLRGHGLARSGVAGEQCCHPDAAPAASAHPPVGQHAFAVSCTN